MALATRFPHSFFPNDAFRDLELMQRYLPAYWNNASDSLGVVNDDNNFVVSIDVSQFKPEEVKVHLDGRVLTVEGAHERKDEFSLWKRSFVRKWTLPEDVDLAAVRSKISDTGHLSIEVPKTVVTPGRTIPIERM